MKKLTILLLFCFGSVFGQYKDDNKSYKTISWNQFFNKLEKNPKLPFFDIRTPGERSDTSAFRNVNIGRIKGALQTDYFDFKSYYPEYLKYKKDTIYLYCSHSRRSRRLAKQLADSSFNVVSVNEGMSALVIHGSKKYPLKEEYYANSLKYKLISPFDLPAKLRNPNVQVVDVRPDTLLNGQTNDEFLNLFGKVKGAKHLPITDFPAMLNQLDKNKEVLLFDVSGDLTPPIADRLLENGFKNIGVLVYGLDEVFGQFASNKRPFLELKYPTIIPSELLKIVDNKSYQIIDIRTETEFNSTDSVAWKNVGRLQNAINIPLSKLTKESLEVYKGKKIIIYDIMMHPELFDAAKILKQNNLDFYLLAGGISFVKWQWANEEKKEFSKLIVE